MLVEDDQYVCIDINLYKNNHSFYDLINSDVTLSTHKQEVTFSLLCAYAKAFSTRGSIHNNWLSDG